MGFRKIILDSGTSFLLGKDAESNEELVKKFKGKSNIILHTAKPGSPFGIIEKTNPDGDDIYAAGVLCAGYSQDWRDNKKDVRVNVFTGKDVYRLKSMPLGTWGVKKQRTIIIKKRDILNLKK